MRTPPRSPEECNHRFAAYASAGDIDGLVSLYEPGACLVGPDGSAAIGHEAVRAALAQFADGAVKLSMNIVKDVRAGDVAVLTNDWQATGRSADGSPIEISGRATEVMRRQPDGTWRYVVDDPYAEFP